MQSIFSYNFNFTEIFAHAIKTPQCNWHRWFWLHGVSNTAMSSSTVSLTPRNQKLFTGTVSREFWPPFFMILSHLGLILICWSMSAYGLEFVEIFVVAINCAMCNWHWGVNIWNLNFQRCFSPVLQKMYTVYSWFLFNWTNDSWAKTSVWQCCGTEFFFIFGSGSTFFYNFGFSSGSNSSSCHILPLKTVL